MNKVDYFSCENAIRTTSNT